MSASLPPDSDKRKGDFRQSTEDEQSQEWLVSEYSTWLSKGDEDDRCLAADKLRWFRTQAVLVIPLLKEAMLNDPSPTVRTIARESLADLLAGIGQNSELLEEAFSNIRKLLAHNTRESDLHVAAALTWLQMFLNSVLTPFGGSASLSTRLVQHSASTAPPAESHPNPNAIKDDEMGARNAKQLTLSDVLSTLDASPDSVREWIESGRAGVRPKQDPHTGAWLFTPNDVKLLRRCALLHDIDVLFDDSGKWLDAPNGRLGGRTPRQVIGTDDEQLVIDVVEGIKHGMVT